MLNGAERLQDWIKRSKCDQREAARILGLNYVFLSQLLNGVRRPGLTNALKIEEVTGISVRSWALTAVSDETSDESEIIAKQAD